MTATPDRPRSQPADETRARSSYAAGNPRLSALPPTLFRLRHLNPPAVTPLPGPVPVRLDTASSVPKAHFASRPSESITPSRAEAARAAEPAGSESNVAWESRVTEADSPAWADPLAPSPHAASTNPSNAYYLRVDQPSASENVATPHRKRWVPAPSYAIAALLVIAAVASLALQRPSVDSTNTPQPFDQDRIAEKATLSTEANVPLSSSAQVVPTLGSESEAEAPGQFVWTPESGDPASIAPETEVDAAPPQADEPLLSSAQEPSSAELILSQSYGDLTRPASAYVSQPAATDGAASSKNASPAPESASLGSPSLNTPSLNSPSLDAPSLAIASTVGTDQKLATSQAASPNAPSRSAPQTYMETSTPVGISDWSRYLPNSASHPAMRTTRTPESPTTSYQKYLQSVEAELPFGPATGSYPSEPADSLEPSPYGTQARLPDSISPSQIR